jgi:hypothetical protein
MPVKCKSKSGFDRHYVHASSSQSFCPAIGGREECSTMVNRAGEAMEISSVTGQRLRGLEWCTSHPGYFKHFDYFQGEARIGLNQ